MNETTAEKIERVKSELEDARRELAEVERLVNGEAE